MSDWQPIETVPHNGDEADRKECGLWHGPCLLFVPDQHGGMMFVAQCDSDDWIIGNEDRAFASLTKSATHWMPLPEPPK